MNGLKKAYLGVLLAVCVLFTAVGAGWSHPPSKLAIVYDRDGGVLTMTASHRVGDGKTHYINEFVLFIDGKKIDSITPSEQKDTTEAVATYSAGDLAKGAVVEVEAVCNKFGKLKEKIVIE